MKGESLHLIIDADPIVYRSGYAAETVSYNCVFEDKTTGDIWDAMVRPMNDETAWDRLKKYLADNPEYELLEKEKLVTVEPVSHALMIVRQTLESIQKEVNFKSKDEMHILLSGPGNYREKLATYRPYKGNRTEAKPEHYQVIRDYLTQIWNAKVVDGREADDETSILAHRFRKRRQKYVIASIDKDLHQIPGIHYDYRLKQQVTVDEEEARIVLWRQALSGDTTDNIPGACGIGAVKAQKMVEGWIDEGWPDQAMWDFTVDLYRMQAASKGCYYCAKDAEKAAMENMRLVYLQREPNELWVPPGQEPEYLKEVDLDD
jgi:hypothetical protein